MGLAQCSYRNRTAPAFVASAGSSKVQLPALLLRRPFLSRFPTSLDQPSCAADKDVPGRNGYDTNWPAIGGFP